MLRDTRPLQSQALTRVATEVHDSAAVALLLRDDGQLVDAASGEVAVAPRGALLGLAAGPTYLHLDAGLFLVTWPNGSETPLSGIERVRAGAFACDGESCYLIDANATHNRVLSVSETAAQVHSSFPC